METEDIQFARVALPTRLDNRVLDLRVSLSVFISQITSSPRRTRGQPRHL